MSSTSNINSLQRYFTARFKEEILPPKARPEAGPAVTLSRETGAGAVTLGEKLARYLESHDGDRESGWAVFDRNLVDKVLDDHSLPGKLGAYMPEGAGNDFQAYVGEFLGLHPSITSLVEKTNETIRKLAKTGNVILVGRGAHLVAASLKNAFHVRLTCRLEKRIERVQAFYELKYDEAVEQVRRKDKERADYVRKHFDRDITDPLSYHLVVNTGLLSDDEVVATIGDAVLRHSGLKSALGKQP